MQYHLTDPTSVVKITSVQPINIEWCAIQEVLIQIGKQLPQKGIVAS